MMILKFTKMHGIGNDYVYFDCVNGSIPENLEETAIRLSDRHFGVGGDGIVLILPSQTCDFRMRMFNAGGSALNSTQVGSLRAAEHISKQTDTPRPAPNYVLPVIKYGRTNIKKIRDDLQTEMSRVADFDRRTNGMKTLFDKVNRLCEEFFDIAVIDRASQTAELFKLYDMILTQRSVLSAMICSAEEIGTHGSAFVDRLPDRSGGTTRQTRTVTKNVVSHMERVSPMPDPELWFETLLARKKQEMKDEKR